MNEEKINVVILAAGKGTRINATDIPKVMYPLVGRPMIGFIADMVKSLPINEVVVVVGFQGQKVIDYLGVSGQFKFVWQEEQLGTGHALAQAETLLKNQPGITVAVNGDNPFFKAETINKMCQEIRENGAVMSVAEVTLDASFSFGRIIKDQRNLVSKIVEVNSATPEELRIQSMNAGVYAFQNDWLWNNINKLAQDKVKGEYLITDLVAIAASQQEKIVAVKVGDSNEAVGINTLENLAVAEDILAKNK